MLSSASRRCRLEPKICYYERENSEKTLVVKEEEEEEWEEE